MTINSIQSPSINFDVKRGTPPAAGVPKTMARMLQFLKNFEHGVLRIVLPDGAATCVGNGTEQVTLKLHNWKVATAVLKSGDIGFAQSYIDGDWETDDLPGLLALVARNRAAAEKLIYGSWWGSLAYRLRHLLHRNTRAGSRKNIHAHYDIGNDFYRLWLDPSMTYSSALFAEADGSGLEQAQAAKYRRVARELRLTPGASVLEIGCGWGGFAEFAATGADVAVTGLTLSPEQLHFARKRADSAGIAERVDLRLQDYRDMHGQYDAIASIEMFEAVGESYWPSYFACIQRNLKPGGRACVQTIVIDDELFPRYRRGTDFIQQYIFPGGMLPSPARFREMAQAHGLHVESELAFGPDYARTTAAWRTAFHRALPQVRELGFDDRFIRTWDFYLAYCEAGFHSADIDVMQFTLHKP